MGKRSCINALCGLYIISTLPGAAAIAAICMCQCLIRAIHHFYLSMLKDNFKKIGVSMPYTGYTSFLPYPSKNGLFPPFLRGVSAGIFQNILINVVLEYFFRPVHNLFIFLKKALL
jgi:hypothetical protein